MFSGGRIGPTSCQWHWQRASLSEPQRAVVLTLTGMRAAAKKRPRLPVDWQLTGAGGPSDSESLTNQAHSTKRRARARARAPGQCQWHHRGRLDSQLAGLGLF
jgi:hypothetical protein